MLPKVDQRCADWSPGSRGWGEVCGRSLGVAVARAKRARSADQKKNKSTKKLENK